MYNIQKTFTNYAWIYFLLLVILGNFFLLNLNLAVIKVKFSETHSSMTNISLKKVKEIPLIYDLFKLKREGIWQSYTQKNKLNDYSILENNKKPLNHILKSNLNSFLFINKKKLSPLIKKCTKDENKFSFLQLNPENNDQDFDIYKKKPTESYKGINTEIHETGLNHFFFFNKFFLNKKIMYKI